MFVCGFFVGVRVSGKSFSPDEAIDPEPALCRSKFFFKSVSGFSPVSVQFRLTQGRDQVSVRPTILWRGVYSALARADFALSTIGEVIRYAIMLLSK